MPRRIATLALVLAVPGAAWAHGVVHEVEDRGGSKAVRARHHGGEPLAGATYQVLAPGAPERVRAEGRTGPDGWLEFAPDVSGTWRVRIADASGHGGVFEVVVRQVVRPDASASAAVAAAAPPSPREPAPVAAAAPASPEPAPTTAPTPRPALRVLTAAAAILFAFAALRASLRAVLRRRGAGR